MRKYRYYLEELVEERTAELKKANEQLQREITERQRAEAELRKYQEHLEELVDARAADLRFANENLQREITERQRTEEELANVNRYLRAILSSTKEGIFTISMDRRIRSCNQAAQEILGYPKSEIIGQTTAKFYPSEEAYLDFGKELYSALEEKGYFAGQFELRRGNGEIFPAEFTVSVLRSGEEQLGLVTVLRDITERKRVEEELRKYRYRLEELVEERAAELKKANEQLQREITERKRAEEALQISYHFLETVNRHMEMIPLLKEFVAEVKNFTGCAAVGLRILDEEGNIPYQAFEGFSRRFYELENPLSIRMDQCMCINVVKGEIDPKLSFYTEGGSFYMNGTTRFLATVSEKEKGRTRNVCNQMGYESVALIPICLGERILGLIHMADPQENMVPLEMVEVLEGAAMQLGTAIQRVQTEEELRKYRDHLEELVEERTAELTRANEQLQREIAERKRAEEALRKERDKAQKYLDIARVIFVAIDTSQKVTLINKRGCEVLGYNEEEIIGKNWFDIFLPERIREEVKTVFQKLMAGEIAPVEYYENSVLTRSGEEKIIAWHNTVLTDEAGNIIGTLGSGEDITERKRAEEALRESKERFRNLFENAPLCIFDVDLGQTPPIIVRANRQAEKVYGWSAEEFASASIEKIAPFEAIPGLERIVEALRAEETITLESINVRRDGSVFPVRVSAASEMVSGPSRIILTIEDITAEENRRSEEKAIAEERRRIAREIHDGLAQDLASIRLKVSMWHNLVDNDPAQMHAELGALRELLSKNIREVRRSIFALRPVALDELGFYPALHQFTDDFGEQNQLHVVLRVSGPEERLLSPLEPVLFRIIQEALNNVGKHAQASTVWVELDLEAAEALTLRIRDDGVGFDPTILDQAVRGGHLGVKQMRERIEGLGGTFLLQSQVGEGTEIQVVLPLSRSQEVNHVTDQTADRRRSSTLSSGPAPDL